MNYMKCKTKIWLICPGHTFKVTGYIFVNYIRSCYLIRKKTNMEGQYRGLADWHVPASLPGVYFWICTSPL